MSLNATISRITESDRFPKSLSEWVVPAAATVTVLLGVNLVLKNSRKSNKPPVVTSWIPWLGSDWAIEADPDAFFAKADREHPGGIYTVKTVGWTFHYVTSPALINQIYRQPKIFHIASPQKMWGHNCFGFPQKFYEGFQELMPDMHRTLSAENVVGFMEIYESQLLSIVKSMTLPTTSVSMEDLVIDLAYKATGAAYFGPTYDIQAALWDVWKPFDDFVWKVALGYPPRLLKNYDRCREEVIKRLEAYVEASPPHQAAPMLASQLELAKALGWNSNDLGRLIVADWWPLMASVPWTSLMLLILQIQRKEGFNDLVVELDKAGAAFENENPDLNGPYTHHLTAFFKSNPPIPLFNSTFAETMRLTTDTYSMRGVMVEEANLGGYTFKKDETLICRTRGVHLDEEQYKNPNEFIPSRYMAADGGKGLEGSLKWLPFGGGHALCPGRYFATYHVKILVATLIKQFNFEIDSQRSKLPVKLGNIHRGFGVRRPTGDLRVKVTRAP